MSIDFLLDIADKYLSSRVAQYPMTEGERECSAALDAVVRARSIIAASAAGAGSEQRPAAQARLDGAQVFEFAAPYFAWNAESWQKATQGTIGMPALLNYTRAVVDAAGAGSAPHAQAEPVAWIAYYDGVKSQNVARDRKEKADIEHMAKIMGYAGRLTWEELYNHAAPVPQEAEQAAPLDDNEVARLRRVVRAMGMEKEVPDDDESLRGCLFSVLGMMARKLEAEQAATAAVTAPAGVTLKAIRAHGSKEWFIYIEHPFGTSYVRMSDRRDLQLAELIACQPAAPAVTDAARDVLADAKGGARYRWLRENCYDTDPAGEGDAFDHPALHFESAELGAYDSSSLDAAIDAEIESRTQSKE